MSDWDDPPCRSDLAIPGRDCPDCLARLIDGPDHCRACGWEREDEWYPFCAPRAGVVSVQDGQDLSEKVA